MSDEKDTEIFSFSNIDEDLIILIQQYGTGLFHYCSNILCDYHEAEDTVQNVFAKVYQNYRQFKGNSAISTWLYRIAYNQCMDLLRSKKYRLPFINEEPKNREAFYEMKDSEQEEIISALKLLPPKDRALLYCRAVEEKSYKELSELFHASETSLRKRYERSKKKLLHILTANALEDGRVHI